MTSGWQPIRGPEQTRMRQYLGMGSTWSKIRGGPNTPGIAERFKRPRQSQPGNLNDKGHSKRATSERRSEMQPSISVIIPTYNRSGVLRYSVESVLNQTYPVSEVIVVDDGSTDDTAALIEREMRDKPSWRERVRYIYQSNQGQSAANNAGISKATSEWLGFNANDDLWSPWKLEWQFRVLAKYHDNCRLCFTDAWFMNNPFLKATLFQTAGRPDGQAFGVVKDPAHLIAKGQHPIWMQTVIARTDLVHEVGGLDESLR